MELFTHPECRLHDTPPGHPERPDRLTAVLDRLQVEGLMDELSVVEPAVAGNDALARVHDPFYIEAVAATSPREGHVRVDADTVLSPGSERAARLAAGAVVQAVEHALDGTSNRAFCAVRPPGHHAESATAMGFCFFNSVAVGADRALDDLDRVAILDFDVHHGNGTVEMFADRPEALVCSSFQYPYYPGIRQQVDRPNIVNTPLPAGTGSAAYRMAVERDWLPALESHRPELILVSAGFDAHAEDPLAGLELQDDDYLWITRFIVDAAERFAAGRIVSTLEGGYNLDALARSAALHVR
ncbi:MAG: histone deacetylase family protein, partial [Gammaproteobacteria bacterium]|nr:histone deacetylase family protein [Gammaproteobacteria bacterium]